MKLSIRAARCSRQEKKNEFEIGIMILSQTFFFSCFVHIRSFVPPVRDEESETQRKAHAKRVRETRRSTQGVTLEEVKSAEQLAKKKQAETVKRRYPCIILFSLLSLRSFFHSLQSSTPTEADTSVTAPADSKSELERRPSWRLCINDNNKNKVSFSSVSIFPSFVFGSSV